MKKILLILLLGFTTTLTGCTQSIEEDTPIYERLVNLEHEDVFVVSIEGNITEIIDARIDGFYEFEGLHGEIVLEVKNMQIRVHETDCPHRDCYRLGFIGLDSYIPIICLPNALMVSPLNAVSNGPSSE